MLHGALVLPHMSQTSSPKPVSLSRSPGNKTTATPNNNGTCCSIEKSNPQFIELKSSNRKCCVLLYVAQEWSPETSRTISRKERGGGGGGHSQDSVVTLTNIVSAGGDDAPPSPIIVNAGSRSVRHPAATHYTYCVCVCAHVQILTHTLLHQ